MREIIIKIKDVDYLNFQEATNNLELRVDEKKLEIIKYYVIVERNRKKFSQATLFNLKPES
jgi:hypothetical protein